MQLLLLALVFGILMHDAFPGVVGGEPALGAWGLLAAVLGPGLAVGGAYHLACRWTIGRLGQPRSRTALLRLDRFTAAHRLLVLGLFAADLRLGVLTAIREAVGDAVLVDEVIVMLPTLGLLAWAWSAYYPIDRRMREAALIGRLDAGLPIYPVWTRGQYLLAQFRHQVALILAPLVLVLGWAEVVELYGPAHFAPLDLDPRPWLMFMGTGVVFLLAPLLIRHLWDTVPLPAGELRDRLTAMCRRHRVGVRELLLWRTFGGMINAAVMGLIAPLRYILLTDGLLELLREEHVEAVMAHELAHVRRRHMFWLLASALGSLVLLEVSLMWLFTELSRAAASDAAVADAVRAGVGEAGLVLLDSPEAALVAAGLTAGMCWIFVFGWVSRRIERQADTFAVQHLVGERAEPVRDAAGRVVVDATSVMTMVAALQQVADLNQTPVERRSWRHGSIAWRQRYLRSLVGRPVDQLAIDRQMRWINGAALAAVGIAAWAVMAGV